MPLAASPPSPPTSIVARKTQNPKFFPLLPFSGLSLSTPDTFYSPPLCLTSRPSTYLQFSSQDQYNVLTNTRQQQHDDDDDEEDRLIGDCLVFEEGIFDDPFLKTPQLSTQIRNDNTKSKKTANEVNQENLIPEKWLQVQKEINITKKERRKLAQQSEYGRKVDKRRQQLKPMSTEEYEKFKDEKLKQLKPVVLQNPEPRFAGRLDVDDGDNEANGVAQGSSSGRVLPTNPRLSVYGGGLDDISQFLNSDSYDPDSAKKPQGTRKLFTKEEKVLLNRRIPDLAVATSGKWHPMHTLAASGDFYLMTSLLKHDVDVNASDKNGMIAIHKAIQGRKQAIFNCLLRESANPFVRDSEGATLMHYAVRTASSQMIKILLLYNIDLNIQDNDGWTPLHVAVQSRRTDVVRLLLIKGSDMSVRNKDGLTPLDLCLYSGNDTRTYELIKLLKQFQKSPVSLIP